MFNWAIFIVSFGPLFYYLTFAPPNEQLIDINPIAYSPERFDSLEGPLKLNNILSNAEHLLVGKIHSPESLVFKNGHLYAPTIGGMVVRIEGSKIVPIAKIGDCNCDNPEDVVKCGRPLGLRFNSKEKLYVVDAIHGLNVIESIDTNETKVTQLLSLSATKNLEGGESKFFDDITIDEGGGQQGGDVIYISDVSTKWDVLSLDHIFVEHDKTGRLLRFDTDSRKVSVVERGLVFPNGLQITDNKQSILMCEEGRQRILQIFIRGPKSGKSEIFAKLPGQCDNIRRSANSDQETYWVAFPSVRNSSNPAIFDRFSKSPLTRKFLSRLAYFSGTLIESISGFFHSESLKNVGNSYKNGSIFVTLAHGMIAEYDANGNAIRSYSSLDGKIGRISEVCEVQGDDGKRILYLGSYANAYLGKLIIK